MSMIRIDSEPADPGPGDLGTRTWRAPRWARSGAGLTALCCLAETARAIYAAALGNPHGIGASCETAVFAFLCLHLALYAARSKVILTPESLIVVNALRTCTIDPGQITDLVGCTYGILVLPRGRRGAFIGAAPLALQKMSSPSSQPAEIANAVAAAARRRAEGR